jgi:hypothetical protein
MTWYADEIIMLASDAAIAEVQRQLLLREHAFHVRTLDGHDWHRPDIAHGLPNGGLIFIQPVCDTSSHGASWHDLPILDWASLQPNDDFDGSLDAAATGKLSDYLGDASQPPMALRLFLTQLAKKLSQPVMYYACGMWGGDIDYEYCLVYSPNEVLFCTHLEDDQLAKVDALCKGLSEIGLQLPTSYFAPHTRGFEWDRHRLVPLNRLENSWPSVVEHYLSYDGESPAVHALGELAAHIANSAIAQGLFAWTSVYDLCIAQKPNSQPYACAYLRIGVLTNGQVEFRFFDNPLKGQQWTRIEPPDRVKERLYDFLRQLCWISVPFTPSKP